MNINQKNLRIKSPAWVIIAFSALTIICQGLPPILGGYDIITEHTKSLVSLFCDILNLVAAAVAPFIGNPNTTNDE